jgi:hypothetical protein
MAERLLTIAQVRALLAKTARPTRSAWAHAHLFSASYVSDVINGKAEIAKRLLDALGLEEVRAYRRYARRRRAPAQPPADEDDD